MPRSPISSQGKSDHDLLIELVTTQRLNHETVLERIGNVQAEISEVRSGISLQIAAQDSRLAVLETFKATKLAEDSIHRWNAAAAWSEKVQDRWKFVLSLWAIVGGIVSALALWLLNAIVVPWIRK